MTRPARQRGVARTWWAGPAQGGTRESRLARAAAVTRENLGASARGVQSVRGHEEPRGLREWNVITADRNDPLPGLAEGMLGEGRAQRTGRRSVSRARALSLLARPPRP